MSAFRGAWQGICSSVFFDLSRVCGSMNERDNAYILGEYVSSVLNTHLLRHRLAHVESVEYLGLFGLE